MVNRLKKLRESCNLTLADLHSKSGVPKSTLCDWEKVGSNTERIIELYLLLIRLNDGIDGISRKNKNTIYNEKEKED